MTPAWRGAWASPRYDQAMNLLRKLRQQKGWTQEHLALVAGIGKRTIQRLERGTVKPTPETAMALANALDVEPDRILNWAGLRSHLRLCLVTWSRRWPEAEELAALPPNLRALFTTFHENRASLAADQQRLSELDAKANAVHELFMELMREDSDAAGACLAAVGDGDGEKLKQQIDGMRSRLHRMRGHHAEQRELGEAMTVVTKRLVETQRVLADAAIRLDGALHGLGVYD